MVILCSISSSLHVEQVTANDAVQAQTTLPNVDGERANLDLATLTSTPETANEDGFPRENQRPNCSLWPTDDNFVFGIGPFFVPML
jgi:hypothetical protein